jgi:hypothetical protein
MNTYAYYFMIFICAFFVSRFVVYLMKPSVYFQSPGIKMLLLIDFFSFLIGISTMYNLHDLSLTTKRLDMFVFWFFFDTISHLITKN